MYATESKINQASHQRQFFTTGQIAPESGVYRVHHSEHRLSHEVTILKDKAFPACSKCAFEVHFELLRAAPNADCDSQLHTVLYNLPVLQNPADESRTKKAS
jgi:hypothetical protein